MWIGKPKDINKYLGFIYLITNKINGMKYIGKKKFWFKGKRKPLKGKKRSRRYLYESDWKTYYGSSKALNADIEKYGKRNFERKILKCFESEWECSYYEAKMQFDNDVLLDDNYYNGWIRVRLTKRGGKNKVTKKED